MSERPPVHVPLFRAALVVVLLAGCLLVLLSVPWEQWVAQTDVVVLAPVREVLAVIEQASAS